MTNESTNSKHSTSLEINQEKKSKNTTIEKSNQELEIIKNQDIHKQSYRRKNPYRMYKGQSNQSFTDQLDEVLLHLKKSKSE